MTYTVRAPADSYAKPAYTGATVAVVGSAQATSYGIADTAAPYSLLGWYGARTAASACGSECFRVATVFTGTTIALTVESAGRWRVLVDGAVCGSRIIETTAAGQVITVNFAESGQHGVEFWGSEGQRWSALSHNGACAAPAAKPKVCVVGDSWIENQWTLTSYPEADGGLDGVGYYLALILDVDVYADGVNMTGYPSYSGGRLANAAAVTPALHIVWGSINDQYRSYTEQYDIAVSLFEQIAAALPGVPVAVFGQQVIVAGDVPAPNSPAQATLDAAKAAANVVWVEDTKPWITAVTQRTCLGPTWIYNGHPNANGGLMMAKRFSAALAAITEAPTTTTTTAATPRFDNFSLSPAT